METQTVQSYVRYRKATEAPQTDNVPFYVLAGLMLIILAIYMWQITLTISAVVLVRYAIKSFEKPVVVEVAPVETPKEKRGYHKRIRVNHYEHGKVTL